MHSSQNMRIQQSVILFLVILSFNLLFNYALLDVHTIP